MPMIWAPVIFRRLHASWVWVMITLAASTTERRIRHPYWPGRKLPVASQWALTSIADTFSTIFPKQLSSEMTLYNLARL